MTLRGILFDVAVVCIVVKGIKIYGTIKEIEGSMKTIEAFKNAGVEGKVEVKL